MVLVILIGSTLGAMILWAMHIDRRRSERAVNKEAETLAAACRKWAAPNREDADSREET